MIFCMWEAFVNIEGKRYYRTGDIGQWEGDKIKLIDRIKFQLKLQQGEWISPSKIEAILEDSTFVRHVVLHADPNHSYVKFSRQIFKK